MCVCVCFLPIHSGHHVRWTYQPGSHKRKVTQDFSSTFLRCVCVCFLPIHSGHKFVGRTSRGHTGGRSHRISRPPSFCGVCVCVFFPFILHINSLDVRAGVTQEEGHKGFLVHLLSAVRAFIFLARRIQPFLSLVDREVEFCVLTT